MLGNMKANMAAALFWLGLLALPKTKCRQNIPAIIRVSTSQEAVEGTVQMMIPHCHVGLKPKYPKKTFPQHFHKAKCRKLLQAREGQY